MGGCNFERASHQQANGSTNLIVLHGGGSLRFFGNRFNGANNSYTNGLIRGIGTPIYPRTITFDSPDQDSPAVSGSYSLLYSDDWTGRGQFVGMTPGVWRAGGVLKTNSILFEDDVAQLNTLNAQNTTAYERLEKQNASLEQAVAELKAAIEKFTPALIKAQN